jgi:predicted AAA+ superfamily ATPase
VYPLTPYFNDPKKELTNKIKLYIADFGIMNFMINRRSIIDSGNYIEMFVAINLFIRSNVTSTLHYWQTRNETEIDFIINYESRLILVECKANNKDIIPKAFRSFEQTY